MRYAVLGTGIVGRTIAAKLASLGHEVVIGTRDPKATLSRTEPDGYGNPPFAEWLGFHDRIRLETFADAAAFGETLVNTTAGDGSLQALETAGAANLAGKVLIDIANPLDFSQGMPPSLNPVNTDSLGEQIQRAFPETKVVKTLNTMNSQIMVQPSRVAGEHTVFVSGDDAGAKQAVTDVLISFGWPESSVIDLGDISTARGVEMLLPIWLRLWGAVGHADFNFHIAGA
ncbi:NADP oxidoreductase [Streptomyces venezuelae]|uniref:NADPH-dependent F420 reductase n=1 Tax=Streptomyces gardneri TaxID=66892 RepID=UPI0006BD65F6|nr:NAD(P)-binding domain-containing protein [Streptomyces gardneri]ALO12459.1 NADP oxidoreductase [Streptomyces venezuelae]QPK49231.1 NAD(P)-binding domain-containing protein [Streptomyces gardneri]WRK40742.1 NAD(P)-binding domain-containing protein [Streptomyces venezuelae]CUM36920.1 NADP oxidoreductase, coenzyme F420-dependent [Streptomyces venezuelae]